MWFRCVFSKILALQLLKMTPFSFETFSNFYSIALISLALNCLVPLLPPGCYLPPINHFWSSQSH